VNEDAAKMLMRLMCGPSEPFKNIWRDLVLAIALDALLIGAVMWWVW
jgi:hypothetical protein